MFGIPVAMRLNFNMEDIGQIIIGSSALAVPISFSEEAWDIGISLPMENLAIVFCLSIVFLAIFTYQSVFQADIRYRVWVFVARIILAYVIAGMVVALILVALDKFPVLSEPMIAFKRLVVVTMPASMGAIIVDSFDKE